jgi:Glutaredoxin-like domain (DUF836)
MCAEPQVAGVRPITVLLYRHAGCHLCDEAEQMLARIARRITMTVQLVDIDADDDLHRRYMFEIPVVTANGVEVGHAPISEGLLEDALATFQQQGAID